MDKNLSELVEECLSQNLGADLAEAERKYTNLQRKHLLDILVKHSNAQSNYAPVSPMLVFESKKLYADEHARILREKHWSVERKYDGVRVIVHFVAGRGVYVQTRIRSRKTNAFGDVTEKLLWTRDLCPHVSMCLDAELVVPDGASTGKRGPVGSLLGQNKENAIATQQNGMRTCVMVFDILRYGDKDLCNEPLHKRRDFIDGAFYASECYTELEDVFYPAARASGDAETKRGFMRDCMINGCEGVVWKNENAKYSPGARPRDAWVKTVF